ncbi:hypothetical protein Poly24_06130 [Rosistilla carotiformis]|uniref:Uncharacterized protein n=1 Tax=Rosistilla carotiformis TaxID=2528017 RepID=A0A518JMZ5_9BACT|nr:hypothetical protein [Rosistilla carotiformis]QDV66924.1 hypothetical protein Poly24_06130 [Rosistilla carotiformis]
MKTSFATLVLLYAFTCVAASTASAAGYGHGMFYHSEAGIRGAAGHYNYGDYSSNYRHAHGHSGVQSPRVFTSQYGYQGNASRVAVPNAMSVRARRSGELCPGMVLPDGAVVVSVGQ